MSVGSGIMHSEYNHSKSAPAKFFQIWIEPKEEDIAPRHDKKAFSFEKNSLTLIVSGKKDKHAMHIHQDAKISLGRYDASKSIRYSTNKGLFIFVIEGSIEVNGEKLNRRDSFETDEDVQIKMITESFFMIIEVPL